MPGGLPLFLLYGFLSTVVMDGGCSIFCDDDTAALAIQAARANRQGRAIADRKVAATKTPAPIRRRLPLRRRCCSINLSVPADDGDVPLFRARVTM